MPEQAPPPPSHPDDGFCVACNRQVQATGTVINSDVENQTLTDPGYGYRRCTKCGVYAVIPYTPEALAAHITYLQPTIAHYQQLKHQVRDLSRDNHLLRNNVSAWQHRANQYQAQTNTPPPALTQDPVDATVLQALRQRVAQLEKRLRDHGLDPDASFQQNPRPVS